MNTQFDFARSADKAPKWKLAALSLIVAADLIALWKWHGLQTERNALLSQVGKVLQASRSLSLVASKTPQVAPKSAVELEQVLDMLSLPWIKNLDQLSDFELPGIVYREVDARADVEKWKVKGQAATFESLQNLIQKAAEKPAIANVKVLSITFPAAKKTPSALSDESIRFEMEVQWNRPLRDLRPVTN